MNKLEVPRSQALQQEKSLQVRKMRNLNITTRESPPAATKTQRSQNYILKIKCKKKKGREQYLSKGNSICKDPEEHGKFKEPRETKEDSVDGAGRVGGPYQLVNVSATPPLPHPRTHSP